MSTEFIAFQAPPGNSLENYDRKAHYDEQPTSVPRTFREAMEVREEVFVKDQDVPLENELDEDDARSFHWVVYASVGNTASSEARRGSDQDDGSPDTERRKSESTATRVPVGTIRLVPPPHAPHPVQGGGEHRRSSIELVKSEGGRIDSPHTVHHDTDEPYIKLGRLATLKPYRGLGLSRLLINAAINWAKENPQDILPPPSPAQIEAVRLKGKEEQKPWKGLILVHAQTKVQKLWEAFGFVKDEAMGSWIEEGIEHVGLWRKVDVKA